MCGKPARGPSGAPHPSPATPHLHQAPVRAVEPSPAFTPAAPPRFIPQVCWTKYGSYPIHRPYCHESAVRILLACIEQHANRWGPLGGAAWGAARAPAAGCFLTHPATHSALANAPTCHLPPTHPPARCLPTPPINPGTSATSRRCCLSPSTFTSASLCASTRRRARSSAARASWRTCSSRRAATAGRCSASARCGQGGRGVEAGPGSAWLAGPAVAALCRQDSYHCQNPRLIRPQPVARPPADRDARQQPQVYARARAHRAAAVSPPRPRPPPRPRRRAPPASPPRCRRARGAPSSPLLAPPAPTPHPTGAPRRGRATLLVAPCGRSPSTTSPLSRACWTRWAGGTRSRRAGRRAARRARPLAGPFTRATPHAPPRPAPHPAPPDPPSAPAIRPPPASWTPRRSGTPSTPASRGCSRAWWRSCPTCRFTTGGGFYRGRFFGGVRGVGEAGKEGRGREEGGSCAAAAEQRRLWRSQPLAGKQDGGAARSPGSPPAPRTPPPPASLHDVCKTVHCTAPKAQVFRSAIINAGWVAGRT
jgi:hypothetical protein